MANSLSVSVKPWDSLVNTVRTVSIRVIIDVRVHKPVVCPYPCRTKWYSLLILGFNGGFTVLYNNVQNDNNGATNTG